MGSPSSVGSPPSAGSPPPAVPPSSAASSSSAFFFFSISCFFFSSVGIFPPNLSANSLDAVSTASPACDCASESDVWPPDCFVIWSFILLIDSSTSFSYSGKISFLTIRVDIAAAFFFSSTLGLKFTNTCIFSSPSGRVAICSRALCVCMRIVFSSSLLIL